MTTTTTVSGLPRLGGRKFVAAMSALAAATLALWFDHLSALLYRDIVLGTVGTYVAGNVAQRVLAKDAAP